MAGKMVGGTSEVQPATEEVQKICDEVKSQVEEKAGKKFDVFTAKCFTTQLVAGTNYFVKLYVGGDEYIHVRIHKALPHSGGKLQLHSVQTPKAHQDPIEYF